MADLQEVRNGIARLLRQEAGLSQLWDSSPRWLARVLNGLSLAVGDETIVYLGGTLDGDEAGFTFRVGVFTESLLITCEARSSGPESRAVVSTNVLSRRDLVRLELTGGDGDGSESLAEWATGSFRIRATYSSGLEVVVPSSEVDSPTKRDSVDAVLNGLRNDLKKRPA